MAGLKIVTMRDVKAERVHWLWKPYIPSAKITIVQGDPGDGKTTMALAIAAAITKGEILPGSGVNAAPANVIFQTAEDGLEYTESGREESQGCHDSPVTALALLPNGAVG